MNKFKLVLISSLFALSSFNVQALSLVGKLNMGGGAYVLNASGTQVSDASNAVSIDFAQNNFRVLAGDGDFAGIARQIGTIKDLAFDPFAGSIKNFWTVGDFSFELTSIKRELSNDPAKFLILSGKGIISAAGFEDTIATWSYASSTTGNGAFSWSAVSVNASIPEVLILLSADTSIPGTLLVTGIAGSVEVNAAVAITNTSNNKTTTVTADATGAFIVNIDGNNGDVLNITVTDVNGNTYTGIPYTVGLIKIITPANGSLIDNNEVNIYGTFLGDVNTGINVNGVTACTYNNDFYLNNLPLTTGINTLTATNTALNGNVQSTAINITQSGSTSYKFTANSNCEAAPLDVTFSIDTGNTIVEQLDIDYDSDGTIDFSTTSPTTATLQHSYTIAGVYPATAWITSGSTVKQLSINIVVKDEAQQDDLLQAVWNGMWSALKIGDKTTAMQYLTPEGTRAYGGIFDSLAPFMTETFDELSVIQPVEINTETADYAVIRLENGVIKTFIINYSRGNDGVWRIDSM